MIRPAHPGEILKEDYLTPLGMSVNRLAADEFWLNLQSLYDLRMAERKTRAKIEREVQPLKVA